MAFMQFRWWRKLKTNRAGSKPQTPHRSPLRMGVFEDRVVPSTLPPLHGIALDLNPPHIQEPSGVIRPWTAPTQATPTISVNDGGTYNGAAYLATATALGTDGQTPVGGTFSYAYYQGGDTTGTPLDSAPVQAGTYTVVASFTSADPNYTNAQAQVTFTIAQATPTVSVSDASGTYGNAAFNATATVAGVVSSGANFDNVPGPTLEGVPVQVTYYAGSFPSSPLMPWLSSTGSNEPPAHAGDYTAVAYFAGSPDYIQGFAVVDITIAPATPTVTVTDAGGSYTGNSFPAMATVAGVDGVSSNRLETVGLNLTYYAGTYTLDTLPAAGGSNTAPTHAGDYTVLASFPGSTDYTASAAVTSFTIAPTSPIVSVRDVGGAFKGAGFSALGTALAVDGQTAVSGSWTYQYYAGDSMTGTPSVTAPAAPGDYTVLATFTSGDPTYTDGKTQTTFTIHQAVPAIAVSDVGGLAGHGSFAASATVAGVIPGVDSTPANALEGVGLTLDYQRFNGDGSQTDLGANVPTAAGQYQVTASFAGSADYLPADAQALFLIATKPIAPTIQIAQLGGVYNGSAYTASASAIGFDGQTQIAGQFHYLYYAGSKALGKPLSGAPVHAGTYTVVADFTSTDALYHNASTHTTFVIRRAAPTLFLSDAGGVYNGKPWPASVTVVGVDGVAANSLEGQRPVVSYFPGNFDNMTALQGALRRHMTVLSHTPPSHVGTYTAFAVVPGSRDYLPASSLVIFSIAPATPTLHFKAGGTYTGHPLAASATITGVNGVPVTSLEGVALLVHYERLDSQGNVIAELGATPPTHVGSYQVTISFTGSRDYLPDVARMTFAITPATPTLHVKDSGGTYNGKPLSAVVSLRGMAGIPSAQLEGVAPTLTYYAGHYTSLALLQMAIMQGTAVALPGAPVQVGDYTVLAFFPGSTDYLANTALATFTITNAQPA